MGHKETRGLSKPITEAATSFGVQSETRFHHLPSLFITDHNTFLIIGAVWELAKCRHGLSPQARGGFGLWVRLSNSVPMLSVVIVSPSRKSRK